MLVEHVRFTRSPRPETTLDDIWCPFPVAPADAALGRALDGETAQWLRDFGLIDDSTEEGRLTGAGIGRLTTYVYPHVADPLPYAKWLTWLFAVDDMFDENVLSDRSLLAAIEDVLTGGDLAGGRPAPVAALADLWEDLARGMDGELRARFRVHVGRYLRSYSTELATARSGVAPQLGDYIALRRDSGAVDACMDLIERGFDGRSGGDERHSEVVSRLRVMTNDVICWVNDIMSVEKEVAHGEMNNLVAVVQQAAGFGFDAAAGVCRAMVAARTREFVDTAEELMGLTVSPHTRRFVDGLQVWMSGSLEWHRQSSRYAGRAR